MRVFLAGGEVPRDFDLICQNKHPYALLSYYHFENGSPSQRAEVIEMANKNNISIIMDSGLFTYMFGAEKDTKVDLPWMLDYQAKYIETVTRYGFKNLTMVECDAHKILGMDAVWRTREVFEKTDLNIMYVWHREEGIPGLETLAKRYKYISIGCPELRFLFSGRDQSYKTAVWDLLSRIRKSTLPGLPKVHLLGNTVMETMETHLAWSCDSTTWLAGVRFGRALYYRDGRLKQTSIKDPVYLAIMKNALEQNPEFTANVIRTATTQTGRERKFHLYMAARAFALYQDYLDRKFAWAGDLTHLKNRTH